MIREDEIREFQEILGTFQGSDSEEEETEIIPEQTQDASEEAPVEMKSADTGNMSILFIVGLSGLVFFISVVIGTIVYIYIIQIKEANDLKATKPANNLKIPGIEKLFTDPPKEGPNSKIKVWVVGKGTPPPPLIYNYSRLFLNPVRYFNRAELELYFNIKLPPRPKRKKRKIINKPMDF